MTLKHLLTSSFPKYCEKLASGKDVCFRPMIVAEEKSLLLAIQSNNKTNIIKTLLTIMTECFDENDMYSYSISDIEQCFLMLRSKSIGEFENFTINCPTTNERVSFSVNLNTDIKINKNTLDSKIKISKDLVLIFNQPTIKNLLTCPDYGTNTENIYEFVAICLKQIHSKSKIIQCSDISDQEKIEFIQNLTPQQFKQVIEYFDSLNIIEIIGEYTTSDTVKRTVNINGLFTLIDFFFNHTTLEIYYIQNFQMNYYHHISLSEINTMIPWEKMIYIEQIKTHLKDETSNQNNTNELVF